MTTPTTCGSYTGHVEQFQHTMYGKIAIKTYKVYQTHPQSTPQGEICSSLQSFAMLHGSWYGVEGSS